MTHAKRQLTAAERIEAVETVLALLATGVTVKRACTKAGIHPTSFWRWRKQDTALNDRVDQVLVGNVVAVYTSALNEALGYDYNEDTYVRGEAGADGEPAELVRTKRVTKHCRASVAAMDLFLRNRDKEYVQRMPETINAFDYAKLRASMTPPAQFARLKKPAAGAS